MGGTHHSKDKNKNCNNKLHNKWQKIKNKKIYKKLQGGSVEKGTTKDFNVTKS